MKNIQGFGQLDSGRLSLRGSTSAIFAVVLMAMFFGFASPAPAQVIPAGDQGGFRIAAGGTGSYYYVGYGQRRIVGASAFVDVETKRHIAFEGEGRWEMFMETADVSVTTYLAGPRFALNNMGRFHPYVKGLIGVGDFTFPYNYAKGSYFVVAPGGGLDYTLTRRIRFRVDGEYQYWPQFTYGALPSYGVSAGIRVRIR
jgi:hypothetical protein